MPAVPQNVEFRELRRTDLDMEGFTDGDEVLEPHGGGSREFFVRRHRLRCGIGAATAVAATMAVANITRGYSSGRTKSHASTAVSLSGTVACAAEGENCLDSHCCWDGGQRGLQCYGKDDFWASCAESCEPGVHEGEKHGTWDQYGNFQLDKWSCKEMGNRSRAGCTTFQTSEACPTDRCMWKGACLPACHNFVTADACSGNDKCMWKGKCMEACDTFESKGTCKPGDKCVWKKDKCEEACWTFGTEACGKIDRCVWGGKECKDNCWTYYTEDECGEHDRCMWRQGKCNPACSTYSTKQSCPAKFGCIWDVEEASGPASCTSDPCGAPGEDCTKSKCCSSQRGAAGFTCFAKDDTYATCMRDCGGDDKKDWSCKAHGNRSRFEPGCAWAGKSCAKDQLCCNIGFNCIVKDETFVGCVHAVQKSTWFAKKLPLPAGWKGDFIGAGRTEYSVPAAPEGQPVAGTTMYCFMAMLPDSQEVDLMKLAKQGKASIFACEASDVFHSWQSAKNGWDTGEATLANTDVFINVWEQVQKSGRYLDFEWTVKVDADAVLVPSRLKQHIAGLRPPANRAIYLKNNAMDAGLGNNGFLGAVEVFSKIAVQIYFDNYHDCKTTLGLNAGEDGFFKGCMDAIGVGFMTDPALFKPDISAGACIAKEHAAFHPLKQPVDWQCCLDILNGHHHNVVYGHCDLGYKLHLK